MKTTSSILTYALLFLVTTVATACNPQATSTTGTEDTSSKEELARSPAQIGAYIVEMFEDSKGNLWFGTLERGVAKYDGKTLSYLTIFDGLPSNRVISVVEDENENLWFGTDEGILKYDGKTFTGFTTEDGLCSNQVSNMMIDSRGEFWIGTWGGVCKFNGTEFTNFDLPTPTVTTQINQDTKNWITEIMEDSNGNMWFARGGYGAYKYDGKTFTHYLKSDGLYSNSVLDIVEDKDGTIWFSGRVAEKDNPDANKRFGKGGITTYDGSTYGHFPGMKGLNDNDVYEIYKDDLDNLWISTVSEGIYKYDGKTFENFPVPKAVSGIMKDSKGRIWMGCAGGLYRLDSGEAVNVTVVGPF